MNILKSLNEVQKKAVLETEGPILIQAGAGSGKTRVVTHKIAYLIEELNINPQNILAITFTNKAAEEMKVRTEQLINNPIDYMWIGTFHSIGARILRRNINKLGYDTSFTIYDRQDQISLLKECYKELNIDPKRFNENYVLSRISDLKNDQIKVNDYLKSIDDNFTDKVLGDIYESYEKKLKDFNSLDFDDLLVKTVELLEKDSDLLNYYQNKFRYIFVDEYQDTNYIQYKLVKLLSDKYNNICVVGDTDQSIYGWRGADIRNIKNFEKEFKNAKTIYLKQNYRSKQSILDVANEVIKNNYKNSISSLWSEKGDGNKPKYYEFENNNEEAKEVVKIIKNLIDSGEYDESDIAILYRTNAQSRNFEDELLYKGLSYRLIGGLKFYDRKEVKDLIGYLNVIQNPVDDTSMRRIINTPKRGIGNVTTQKLSDYSRLNNMSLYEALLEVENINTLGGAAKSKLSKFIDMINMFIAKKELMSIKDLILDIIDSTGYIEELKKEESVQSRSRIENIEEFVSVISQFEKENEDNSLESFLQKMSLLSDIDKVDDAGKKVTLMTIHSAKGLEFPVVFLTGLEEGIFPSIYNDDDSTEEIEEERRLCYVAITRAEEILYLTRSKVRTIYGRDRYNLESRFIKEMGDTIERKDLVSNYFKTNDYKKRVYNVKSNINLNSVGKRENIDLNLGDKINHNKWGEGLIVEVKGQGDDKIVTVSFENKGLKRLIASSPAIKKIGG